MRVLTATGAELERDFAFGIVRQLFEPELLAPTSAASDCSPARRVRAPLDGPYEPALSNDACHCAARPRLARRQPRGGTAAGARDRRRSLGRRRQPARARHARPPARGAADRADRRHPPGRAARCSRSWRGATVHLPAAAEPAAVGRACSDAVDGEATRSWPPPPRPPAATRCWSASCAHARRRRLHAAPRRGGSGPSRPCPGTITRMVRTRLAAASPRTPGARPRRAAVGDRRAGRRRRWPGSTTRPPRAPTPSSPTANLLERDGLCFTHPMMREAALAGVVAGERSALHRRAARCSSPRARARTRSPRTSSPPSRAGPGARRRC